MAVWELDVPSERVTSSAQLNAMLGYGEGETLNLDSLRRHFLPGERDRVRAMIDACLASGEPFVETDFRYRGPDAVEKWLLLRCEFVRNADGRPAKAVGVLTDITASKQVEAALRESEARFRTLANSAPAPVWTTGASGAVEFVNQAFVDIVGRPAEDLLGDAWISLIHPDDLKGVAQARSAAWVDFSSYDFEARFRSASGEWRWMLSSSKPRPAADGTFGGYVGLAIDVTERRIAEDELRGLNETLEKRVAERTEELAAANRQLMAQIHEREAVEETLTQMQRLEAVGQLSSGIAHDFNNLLSVILGNAGFLERELAGLGASDKMRLRLDHMRNAAQRGAALTGQLLAFSRRQRLEAKAVDLNETIAGMQDLLQSAMGGAIGVQTELRSGVWRALVDPAQIELVILNLAINGRDAMEEGGRLKIETANVTLGPPRRPEEPGAGDYVMVAVSDTGTGMSDDVLGKAFEPFFTTKPVGKGSGLGLPQVYGFAKQSGGGVAIETAPGSGCTVKVYLPRSLAGAGARATSPELAPAKAGRRAERVLLVDDDADVRATTSAMLQDLGCWVVEAASGGAALRAIEVDSQPFDLAILDFAMPGMNGAEVARQAVSRQPGLPVMFITGYADLSALSDVAAERILQKPFEHQELSDRINRLLGGD